MRTCGGTARLCRTLYHAGLTADLLAVLRVLREEGRGPVFLAGFSLGGNVVLKLAGELGAAARPLIRAVCAVSTPLDLEACARRLARPRNRLYELRFVRRMRARLLATGLYSPSELAGLRRLSAIDERITARSFGFAGASDYYRTQSAIRYLGGLRTPTLLVQAKDDPFIPFGIFESEAVAANSWIELAAAPHGGHLGFLGRKGNRFWADDVVMRWFIAENATKETVSPSR
jgi:predicted alpha/beta-fold hydrolase